MQQDQSREICRGDCEHCLRGDHGEKSGDDLEGDGVDGFLHLGLSAGGY